MQRGSGRADAPLGDPVPVVQIRGPSALDSSQSPVQQVGPHVPFPALRGGTCAQRQRGSSEGILRWRRGFRQRSLFDLGIDNNVRTEARRLRAKLEEYYSTTGQSDLVRIALPKGSYTPSFVAVQPRVEEAIAVETLPSAKWFILNSRWLLLSVILLAAALGGPTWYRTEFVRASGRPRSIAVLPFLNLSLSSVPES
jgi:hypothetical protein